MIIRQEQESDYKQIKLLVKEAFATAEHTDENEYILVDDLRKSDGFVKELTLVVEDSEKLIGHIMFTRLTVSGKTGLALAPLSVLPSAQRKGVGTALMQRAFDKARQFGYEFVVVLGSEKYYPRFGFKPAINFGILAPFDVVNENFMVLFLTDKEQEIHGTVEYVKEMLG